MLVALLTHPLSYVAVLGPSLALMFYLFKRHPSQAPEPAEIRDGMAPDLRDLRAHLDPRTIGGRKKRDVQTRLRALLPGR